MNVLITLSDFEKIFNFNFNSLNEKVNEFYLNSNSKKFDLIKKIISNNNYDFILNASFLDLNDIKLLDNYEDYLIAFLIKNEPFVINLDISQSMIENINLFYNTKLSSYNIPYSSFPQIIDWDKLSNISKKITESNALNILNSIDDDKLLLEFYNQIRNDLNFDSILKSSLNNDKFLKFLINNNIYSLESLMDLNVNTDAFIDLLKDHLSHQNYNLNDIYSSINNIYSYADYNEHENLNSNNFLDNDFIMDFNHLIYYYQSYINNSYNLEINLKKIDIDNIDLNINNTINLILKNVGIIKKHVKKTNDKIINYINTNETAMYKFIKKSITDIEMLKNINIKYNDEIVNLFIKTNNFNVLPKDIINNLSNEQIEYIFLNTSYSHIKTNDFFNDNKIHQFLLYCEKNENNLFLLHNKNSILFNYKSENEYIKNTLFKFNPQDRINFMDLKSLTEDDIVYYYKNSLFANLNINNIISNISNFKNFDNVLFITQINPDILKSKKIPLKWKSNPDIIENILKENNIDLKFNLNLSKENLQKIILNSKNTQQIFNILSLDKKHSIIEFIPNNIKLNFDFIKSIYSSNNFDESFKIKFLNELPNYIKLNHSLLSEILYKNLNLTSAIDNKLWNDSNFVFYFFNNLPSNLESRIVSYLPLSLKNFFIKNEISSNFNNHISNYLLELDLNDNIIKNNVKKIKI